MYVAVKGGAAAIESSWRLLDTQRRGDPAIAELSVAQIRSQLTLAVDRVMSEGSLYDPELAAHGLEREPPEVDVAQKNLGTLGAGCRFYLQPPALAHFHGKGRSRKNKQTKRREGRSQKASHSPSPKCGGPIAFHGPSLNSQPNASR